MHKWFKSLFGKKKSFGLPDDLILNEVPPVNNLATDNKISITDDMRTVGYGNKRPRRSKIKSKKSKSVKTKIKQPSK